MEGKCVDRLSSLPDDILIGILSTFPLQFAILTGCLSSRWRHLWKHLDSIDVFKPKLQTISEFFTAFSNTVSQFKSPFIRSFTLIFVSPEKRRCLDTDDFSWLREICDRNVREIKLICSYGLPSFFFQTSSLVSIELVSNIYWEFPDSIDLPNLKNLSLRIRTGRCKCISKLINACPSLEQLSLISELLSSPEILRLSNQKLMRLALNLESSKDAKIVISAPKLEYLDISVPSSVKLNFEEGTLGLREAKIRVIDCNGRAIKFNSPIAGVKILTLNGELTVRNTSSVFHNATQVTLNTYVFHCIENVLALMKLCPVLDDLCLNYFKARYFAENLSIPLKGTLLRGLKKITIKILARDHFSDMPSQSFLKLVEYLLGNVVNLKYFHFSVDLDDPHKSWNAERRQRREFNFCQLLYNCPSLPLGCEVEFKGVYLNMSRKLGPKAWTTDGEVIAFDHSPWDGFVLLEN